MTTNSQLLTITPKKTKNENKLRKQLEREQNHRNEDHMESYQQVENRQEEVKNSIGNVEAKELICTTHGHELKGGGWRGIKGVKWDN